MNQVIVKELKITPKKAVLHYHESPIDPVLRTLTLQGQRDNTIQSHIDAIAQHIVEDAMAVYENDKKQQELGFGPDVSNSSKLTVSVGDDEDDENFAPDITVTATTTDPTDFEKVMERDWSDAQVPFHDDTMIPNFKAMEKEHRDWFINNHYQDPDAEFSEGFDIEDLRQDVKYNYGEKLHHRLSLEKAKLKAISLL